MRSLCFSFSIYTVTPYFAHKIVSKPTKRSDHAMRKNADHRDGSPLEANEILIYRQKLDE